MATHVAFLRAVNVGGRSVVRMANVKEAFERAGCENVSTLIASGNVLFDTSSRLSDALAAQIHRNVRALLNAEPVIVYRTGAELRALIEERPFGAVAGDPLVKRYVVFALDRPARRPTFPLRLPKEGLEAIGMKGRDILLVSRRKPNGMYGFPNNWIEKELGIVATARNWSTVTRIVGRCG